MVIKINQRRRTRIAMDRDEVSDFLTTSGTCRVATLGSGGPHVTPLWYVWDGESIWLSTLVDSQRWVDLSRDPRIALVVDDGEDFQSLRGVELRGSVVTVGETPRTGDPDPRLLEPERLFAQKYLRAEEMPHDGRHAWLRVVPDQVISWDHRKLP